MTPRACGVLKLGLADYSWAWRLQQQLLDLRRTDQIPDLLLLLEHPPTYTIGRRGHGENLLASPDLLAGLGIGLYWIERGGDITFHGPGQLVGYPILDLKRFGKDVHLYLRRLEELLIRSVGDFGIRADRVAGLTGVWAGDEKIAAIGVSVKHWITMHGFALNVNTDLAYFDTIIPCGIKGKKVTSMEKVLAQPVELARVQERLVSHFAGLFEMDVREVTLAEFFLAGDSSNERHGSSQASSRMAQG
jgi:lipoate-protein ligase B